MANLIVHQAGNRFEGRSDSHCNLTDLFGGRLSLTPKGTRSLEAPFRRQSRRRMMGSRIGAGAALIASRTEHSPCVAILSCADEVINDRATELERRPDAEGS